MDILIPETLVHAVSGYRGGEGLDWLRSLPGLLDECREHWGLSLGEPFPYPSLSFVAPGTRADGTAVVLKVGFLRGELARESQALRIFDGRGCVRLLDALPEQGALLLERAEPGTQLAEMADENQVTEAGVAVLRELWCPAPPEHGFPTVADYAGGLANLRRHFRGSTGPLPAMLVEQAEGLAADLLASAPDPVLLHGDFQHFNILRASRQPWLAIDPKGVVGDPAYELGRFLCNRLEVTDDPDRYLPWATDCFSAELGLDRARVVAWGLVGCVVSACWEVEDKGCVWEEAIACAERFAALLACG